MFNILIHKGNANQNIEIPSHSTQNGNLYEKIINVSKDAGKRNP
jgi:hypothetical protein